MDELFILTRQRRAMRQLRRERSAQTYRHRNYGDSRDSHACAAALEGGSRGADAHLLAAARASCRASCREPIANAKKFAPNLRNQVRSAPAKN
jgi:hypothetical protein